MSIKKSLKTVPIVRLFAEKRKTIKYRRRANDISDYDYIQNQYKLYLDRELNLATPQRYTDKLQWLKLYYRRADYTNMVDKFKVREFVQEIIGERYLVPLIGKWDSFDQIDRTMLPNQFVLKCNHDQGSVVICKDKSLFDWEEAEKKLTKKLNKNHYWLIREWPYKNIIPCIIGETYLENDLGDEELTDYKVLCFNGIPKLIEVHCGRFKGFHTQDFYDTNWRKTEFSQPCDPVTDIVLPKPVFLEEMLKLSRCLARTFPHVRVDWYYTGGKLYFSELTFYDGSGYEPFEGNQDEIIGEWLSLPSERYTT